MSNEQIGNFVEEKFLGMKPVMINLKVRGTFKGLFIQAADYRELKAKNFWRVVSEANIENYLKAPNLNLSRIFNGMEITRLSAPSQS